MLKEDQETYEAWKRLVFIFMWGSMLFFVSVVAYILHDMITSLVMYYMERN